MTDVTPSPVARWCFAGAVTVGFGVLVARLAGPAEIVRLASGLPWLEVAAGVLLLQGEGLITVRRVRQLAAPRPTLIDTLDVTARWVAALILMPARLGELYGLHLMTRRLGQSPGRALNNLFVQRLFDFMMLAMVGGCALAAGTVAGPDRNLLGGAFALLLAAMVLVAWRLSALFAGAARLCMRGRHQVPGRQLLRFALQGRRAARDTLGGRRAGRLLGTAMLKWLCNLVGTVVLLRALVPTLPADAALGLVVLANLAAVLPVSGLGGVGAPDFTIAGGLGWLGVPAAAAAGAALGLRVLLLAATLTFTLFVLAGTRLTRLSGTR